MGTFWSVALCFGHIPEDILSKRIRAGLFFLFPTSATKAAHNIQVSPSSTTRRSFSAAGTALNAKATGNDPIGSDDRPARSVDGVGTIGSNVLLLFSLLLVVKGLFLPEEIRQEIPRRTTFPLYLISKNQESKAKSEKEKYTDNEQRAI